MDVRPAERRDVDGIFAMWEALQSQGTASDPRYATATGARTTWLKAGFAEDCLRKVPFPGCLVADDGALCGFVTGTLTGPTYVLAPVAGARIDSLYVAPRVRRQGVGRRLVETFIAVAERAGVDGVDVGTLIKDERAVAFWKGLGFDPMRITLVRPPRKTT